MRTVHLIRGSCAPHADLPVTSAFGAMAACARAVAAQPASEHRVVLLGDHRARRDAALAGLRVDRRVHPPLGISALAWTQVRRERSRGPVRVRLWSPGLGALARRVTRGPIEDTAWSAGAGGSEASADLTEAPLALHDASSSGAGRQEVRTALGARPGDRVVFLLADPPAQGDARRFAFILGLLEVGIGPVVGVMAAGSTQTPRARRFHRLAVRRSPLLAVEGSVIPWLHAADAAVLEGPDDDASRAAVRAAMGLGIPLVGPAWLAAVPARPTQRVYSTDGRTRTLLPAILQALGAPARPEPPAGG